MSQAWSLMMFSYSGVAQLQKLSFSFKSSVSSQLTSERILSCFRKSFWILCPCGFWFKKQKQSELVYFLSCIYRGKITLKRKCIEIRIPRWRNRFIEKKKFSRGNTTDTLVHLVEITPCLSRKLLPLRVVSTERAGGNGDMSI